jgi:ribonucleotide monophosphatase NagD (HAD superfamily)
MLYVFLHHSMFPPSCWQIYPFVCLHLQDEVFGSAYAAAVYLSSVLKFPMDKRVYVIGMSGLEDELRNEGISFIGGTVSVTSSVIFPTHISFAVIAGSCR